jgi:pimeloyl-ACP methyl ester carboxylesterase
MSEGSLRAAVGGPMPVEMIEVEGSRLAISRRGKGTPVICLHATGHGGGDFNLFAERVGSHFEVITIDWPGQGRSLQDEFAASAAHYASLLEAAIPRLTPEQPILLGNSIGGAAALLYAARHPERVRALVLCNPGGLAPLDPVARTFIRGMIAFFSAGARGAGWFPAAFAAYYRMVLRRKPASEQRARIVASCREIAPVLAQAWRSFGRPEADLRALVPALAVPVFYAWAKDDQVVAWSRSKAAALRAPNHHVEMFRGGHAPFLEEPDAFARSFIAYARYIASQEKDHEPVRYHAR